MPPKPEPSRQGCNINQLGDRICNSIGNQTQIGHQQFVFAVANLTRICIPYLQKGSHVVTISSMGGIQGSLKFAGLAAYSSSKGAVITLSELLAEEYKEQGISFRVLGTNHRSEHSKCSP